MPPDNRRIAGQGAGLSGLLGRVIATLVTVAAVVAGFMFSMVLFAVALVGGLIAFGWMWWKFRRALRQARLDPRQAPPSGDGRIIEGEVISGEWRDETDRRR